MTVVVMAGWWPLRLGALLRGIQKHWNMLVYFSLSKGVNVGPLKGVRRLFG